jgi:hypothetical protein
MGRTFALASVAAVVSSVAFVAVVACSSSNAAAPSADHDAAPTPASNDACATCEGSEDAPFNDDGGIVGFGCSVDTDCSDGGRCGYPTLSGCAATGVCVTPDVPLDDGAPLVACGCDGQDVGYVTSDLTSAPASSLSPCVDAGASDDGDTDGPSDASDAG